MRNRLSQVRGKDSAPAASIDRVVQAVIRRRASGDRIDPEAIARQYPHLMPQLADRLRELKAIEDAADHADHLPLAGTVPGDGDSPIDDGLNYLSAGLSGYELLERLEYGGQGIVYKAVQLSTDRVVAIKVLLDGPLASERRRQRFVREVELVSRLQHPNIVTLYDSGVVRGRYFFAMEFVEGLPIHDYVLVHGPTVRQRLELFVLVCRAVNHAHQHGIIHRDLKPSNILVDRDGQPHILDFGLAKDLWSGGAGPDDASVSIAGQVVGTLPYLSPEQARGAGEAVDVRSDVYSLGVVLFELLTDAYPYPVHGDPREVRNNILSREPLRLRAALTDEDRGGGVRAEDVGDDLEAIVFKALAKEKDERYPFAADLAADLERYLRGDAVQAKAGRRVYLLRKAIRRYRVPVAVTAAFVLVLLGSLFAATLAWQRAARDARIYQAGLQMGSYLKLGSVRRDEDRVDQAIAMFEKAIELGRGLSTTDSAVNRYLYDAHYSLAVLYRENGELDKAAPHADAAAKITNDMVRHYPDDPEWRRVLAFSHLLRGRLFYSRGEWTQALDELGKAVSIREKLLSFEPDSLSLKSELADALSSLGKCHRRLGQHQESKRCYNVARRFYAQLHESQSDVVQYAIELSRIESMIAVLHMSHRTTEDDQIALDWLQRAEHRLLALDERGSLEGHEWTFRRLLRPIRENQQILRRRGEGRANRDD